MSKTNKRLILIFVCISMFLTLVACNKSEYLFNGLVIPSKNNLLKLKSSFQISDEDIHSFLDENQTVEKQLDVLRNISYDVKYNKNRILDKKAAEADIDFYFQTLKDCYAGYIPNGGEEKFEAVKTSIKSEIPNEISTIEFEEILKSNMSFVKDAHFMIGGNIKFTINPWYIVDNINIGKDNKGYYDISNGKYIKNKDEIESFLRPSLSEDNSLQYKLFSQDVTILPLKIEYKDGEALDLKHTPIYSKYNIDNDVDFKEFGKVQYLKFPRFFHPNEGDKIKEILDAIDKMSKSEYGILDLRGNAGGNAILVDQIFQHYTGENVLYSSDAIYILNPDAFEYSENGQTWEEYIKYSNAEIYDDNHTIERHSKKTIHKDGLLIVLTDGTTASAGEKLVDALHHIDNAVFVGMPTMGCANGSMLCALPMKNSGISFTFGNIWNVFNEDYFQEYRGFLPDIWISDVDVEGLAELLNSYSN